MTIMIKKRGYWCLRVVYTLCQCPESDGRNFLAAIVPSLVLPGARTIPSVIAELQMA
jgi:hypothetical protein